LHQDRRDWVVEITHSQYAVRALDWIFQRPIFQTPDFIASAQIPPPTARKIIRDLRANGLLRELVPASGRAPATFVFSELLDIAEGRRHLTVSFAIADVYGSLQGLETSR
jgi:hypothetical protein